MPIYDFLCPSCGPKVDVWAGINDEIMVCECGNAMHRQISATRSNPDWEPYIDENLCRMHGTESTLVKSRQHRTEIMGKLGLIDKWGVGRKQRWV